MEIKKSKHKVKQKNILIKILIINCRQTKKLNFRIFLQSIIVITKRPKDFHKILLFLDIRTCQTSQSRNKI
jgi:hypothetical protein